MKARVYITLKRGIHDPQGQAVQQSLRTLGFSGVRDVRMGKILDVTLDESDREKAEALLHEMCAKLLANPVIEDFHYTFDEE
ncbi:MAG: phosphoribosylformylglycinamidine synthase subunit PurS [Nitrospirae bacterium]|nr:MAG: phosphoribosylformylglycinamidine synthase subunit PurS [Nitrospirota bacterium]